MRYWVLAIVISVLITPFALRGGLVNDMVIKVLFSNKAYAKHIEVKTYILTQEQMPDLFNNPDLEPTILPAEELNNLKNEKCYGVLRVKNLGNLHAWGKLTCKIPGIHGSVIMVIPRICNYYCDYVICLSGAYLSTAENSLYPKITYEWKELYTK